MVGALPSRMSPPHLPRSPSVMAFSLESVEAPRVLTSADSASTDVNVIGIENVPDALMTPPFKTTRRRSGVRIRDGQPIHGGAGGLVAAVFVKQADVPGRS